uniref:Si:ch211-140b10.6 n=1 Tax=Neogobius melanostomus TaxID=47308 RepID=A0A8C6SW09_9GOBI
MAEDNDLEKRAIEELLRETDRARVRAETMGPSGWLKCPLKTTNKRFLLNTLRSTGLHRRSDESRSESASRGRFRSESPERRRERSISPSPRRERHRDHRDKYHREDGSSMKLKRREKEEERRERHTREEKHDRGRDGHKKHGHK